MKLKTAHCSKLRELEGEIQSFCFKAMINEPICLTLTGDPGTAKTHCLRKVARFLHTHASLAWRIGLWKKPMSISSIVWSDIASEDRVDNDLLFTETREADVLLLDDFGSEVDRFKTNESKERARILIGGRERKISLITTNIPVVNWSTVWDARIEDRLLRGNSSVFEMSGIPRFSEVSQ